MAVSFESCNNTWNGLAIPPSYTVTENVTRPGDATTTFCVTACDVNENVNEFGAHLPNDGVLTPAPKHPSPNV
ncbi:unannotated protein [freshwater metagenome]|uniref:Unannotated protein n=1 Tax=freshwater metagenome TaxID=449393 RepID=A0A6J6TYP4_9ZZZZ